MSEQPKIKIIISGQASELKKAVQEAIDKSKVRVNWTQEEKAALAAKPVSVREQDGQTVSEYNDTRKKVEHFELQLGELYRQKCKVANELVDLPDDSPLEQAQRMISEIQSIRHQYNQFAQAVNQYKKTGKLPEPAHLEEKPKLSELNKAELMQRRANLRPNITKAKSAIDKHQRNPQKLVIYEQKLASLQAELNQVEELLMKG